MPNLQCSYFIFNKTPGRAFTLAAKWRHVIVIYKKKEIEDIDVRSYLFSVKFCLHKMALM